MLPLNDPKGYLQMLLLQPLLPLLQLLVLLLLSLLQR